MNDDSSNGAEQHTVSAVRAFTNGGGVAERRLVQCPREGGTVQLARCMKCPHQIALRYSRGGRVTHVSCQVSQPSHPPVQKPHMNLEKAAIADLMTRNVLCVTEDLSLDAIAGVFLETGIKAAPVLDAAGVLVGIVCESEVMLHVQAHRTAEKGGYGASALATVADVMTPFVIAMHEHSSVTRAAAVMAYEHARRVVVVSDSGEIVGILSASDILYWLARSDGFVFDPPCRTELPYEVDEPRPTK